MIILQNCRDEDITIPRCSNIGYIENVKNPYFDKISVVKPNDWEGKVSDYSKLQEPDPSTMMCSARTGKIWARQKILSTKLI
jgi:hypothetical protein